VTPETGKECTVLHIQIPYIQRVLLDELPSRLDLVAHADAIKGAVGFQSKASLLKEYCKTGGREVAIVRKGVVNVQPPHHSEGDLVDNSGLGSRTLSIRNPGRSPVIIDWINKAPVLLHRLSQSYDV
jgi:hypothetical protein